MNTDSENTLRTQNAGGASRIEPAEPTVGSARPPIWIFVLFGALFYGSQLYVDGHAGGFNAQVYEPYPSIEFVNDLQVKSEDEIFFAKGRLVYASSCAVCHQASGLGSPGQFPPLAGSEWALAAGPGRIIRLVLDGGQGAMEVKGQVYATAAMPPWKDVLKDEDIAAVLTFVRMNKEWGNSATGVKPQQVKAIREKMKDRTSTWDPSELKNAPENE